MLAGFKHRQVDHETGVVEGGFNMKRTARVLFLLVVLSAVGGYVDAADFQIIVHPSSSVQSISKMDLSRLFLRQRSRWESGGHAKPIDLKIKTNSEVRRAFSEQVLDRTLAAVDSYWNSQVFAGKGAPPPTAKTEQEVISYVRTTPGAVGYVSSSADTSGVRVISVHE